jgi:hypothetical protein
MSFPLGVLLIGVNVFWALSAAEALAAPIAKGDLVVTMSDGTQLKSEDQVLMTLPADTSLVAAEVQDDWVLARVRKEGKESTGFVQAASVRRVAMSKHTDPQGFSLQYPESWNIVSADERAEVAQKSKEYTEKLPSAPPPLACIISNAAKRKTDFQQTINCVVSPGSAEEEIDDGFAKKLAGKMAEVCAKMGLRVANVHSEVVKVGNRKAISYRHDVTVKGLKEPLRQWQVIVHGKSQDYTFTCTADVSDFWRYEPLFAAIIQSIEVDVVSAAESRKS